MRSRRFFCSLALNALTAAVLSAAAEAQTVASIDYGSNAGINRAPGEYDFVNNDSVADDDLGSDFFGNSIDEVEGAATRMFDVGIRTVTNDAAPGASGAFAAPSGDARPASAAPPAADLPAALQDDAARRAFILGGPDALA